MELNKNDTYSIKIYQKNTKQEITLINRTFEQVICFSFVFLNPVSESYFILMNERTFEKIKSKDFIKLINLDNFKTEIKEKKGLNARITIDCFFEHHFLK